MSENEMSRQEVFALLQRLDPHYAMLLQDFHNAVDGIEEGLSTRLASLCAIATAAAFESSAQLEEYLKGAAAAGVTPEEALETIFYTSSFAGFRALSRGLGVFVDVFGEKVKGQKVSDYPDGPRIDGYDGPGLEVGIEMYGPIRARMNIENFRAIGRPFADALERYAYTGLFRRTVLTPFEREIASVAMLSALEKPGSFVWHVKAALRLGATPEQLKYSIVKQIPISGVLRAFAALRAMADTITDWRAHPSSDTI
jgi:alkylhydroperoxidase/carboxymuconolactone decarboxylase family protein YurZ